MRKKWRVVLSSTKSVTVFNCRSQKQAYGFIDQVVADGVRSKTATFHTAHVEYDEWCGWELFERLTWKELAR